ncbi:hypothetical protein NKI66_16545 [Mesorhizobium sp. M0518]|uniref:hypothetical protein n=1 Tax=Mesorhizobium sp. M0518 TaxID=2956956 RepID=UPI00333E036C
MQWTERHVVLLVDKQVFEVPPHRTGNIGPMRTAATLRQASGAHIELVLPFFGFKSPAKKFYIEQKKGQGTVMARLFSEPLTFSRSLFVEGPADRPGIGRVQADA